MGTGPNAWWRCRRFRRLLLRSGLLTLLLVSPVIGVRVYDAITYSRLESRLRQVKPGMPIADVIELVGEPDLQYSGYFVYGTSRRIALYELELEQFSTQAVIVCGADRTVDKVLRTKELSRTNRDQLSTYELLWLIARYCDT